MNMTIHLKNLIFILNRPLLALRRFFEISVEAMTMEEINLVTVAAKCDDGLRSLCAFHKQWRN